LKSPALLEYTLLTSHYHLLLKIKKKALSSGFKRLPSRYARAYNRRHNRRGVVWLRRFHDVMIESDRHLFETVRYIAQNAPAEAVASDEARTLVRRLGTR
jgi:putative transposase